MATSARPISVQRGFPVRRMDNVELLDVTIGLAPDDVRRTVQNVPRIRDMHAAGRVRDRGRQAVPRGVGPGEGAGRAGLCAEAGGGIEGTLNVQRATRNAQVGRSGPRRGWRQKESRPTNGRGGRHNRLPLPQPHQAGDQPSSLHRSFFAVRAHCRMSNYVTLYRRSTTQPHPSILVCRMSRRDPFFP